MDKRISLVKAETRVLLSDIQRIDYEIQMLKERIAECQSKIKMHTQLPHAIGTFQERFEGNACVVSSSQRSQLYLMDCGLISSSSLKVGDTVALHKDTGIVLEKAASDFDVRTKAFFVDFEIKETFQDIGGLERQVEELLEAIELPMKHPQKFKDFGIAPTKGVLLYGPPGTGKTLVARAAAARTNAAFFRLAGPQLVQMYIGDGAKLVRDTFHQARNLSESIQDNTKKDIKKEDQDNLTKSENTNFNLDNSANDINLNRNKLNSSLSNSPDGRTSVSHNLKNNNNPTPCNSPNDSNSEDPSSNDFPGDGRSAIIFIDEIDAIGLKRCDGDRTGDREVQRTMLELLNQLDGFTTNERVKVIAATNRVDILDPALLRSGRLDRKIEFTLPTTDGRRRILQIHARKMITNNVDYNELARNTEGFNGAQLKAVCTEAGMVALRKERVCVEHRDFMDGIQEVISKKKLTLHYHS